LPGPVHESASATPVAQCLSIVTLAVREPFLGRSCGAKLLASAVRAFRLTLERTNGSRARYAIRRRGRTGHRARSRQRLSRVMALFVLSHAPSLGPASTRPSLYFISRERMLPASGCAPTDSEGAAPDPSGRALWRHLVSANNCPPGGGHARCARTVDAMTEGLDSSYVRRLRDL
jgi:hypothetical protein